MCVGAECWEVAMWVWSDELIERASKKSANRFHGGPLVAYAVTSEADLDALVLEVLSGSTPEVAKPGSEGRDTGVR